MSQEMYEMQECIVCKAAIPVNPEMAIVTCGFCGAEYDIINHGKSDHQGADHQIGAWPAFFIGSILGLGFGAVVFTATGRSMAAHAIAKGGNLAYNTVEGYLSKGNK